PTPAFCGVHPVLARYCPSYLSAAATGTLVSEFAKQRRTDVQRQAQIAAGLQGIESDRRSVSILAINPPPILHLLPSGGFRRANCLSQCRQRVVGPGVSQDQEYSMENGVVPGRSAALKARPSWPTTSLSLDLGC